MNTNLPALAAAIVNAIRNSVGDSAHNQATVVQHMIQEAITEVKQKTAPVFHIFSTPEELREFREVMDKKSEPTTDQTASAVNKARMDKEAAVWREASEMAEAWCQTKDPYRRDREVYCYRAGYLKALRQSEAMDIRAVEPDDHPMIPARFKPTFIPKPPSPEVQEMWAKLNEATTRVVRENNLRIEQLTEAQCVQAIIQAFQCGDFKRLVRHGDFAQQVVYLPFAEREGLKSEVQKLKDLIRHYWIHAGYKDCGFLQMETAQKKLFVALLNEFDHKAAAERLSKFIEGNDEE